MNKIQEMIALKGIGLSLSQMDKPNINEANKMLEQFGLQVKPINDLGTTITIKLTNGNIKIIKLSELNEGSYILYNGKFINETSQIIMQICNLLEVSLEDIAIITLNN